jgi:hypothetical protein
MQITKEYISACGCEERSLTLREERSLRVFENRMLRRIFGLKRGEIFGGWRKLYDEQFRKLYSSPSTIRNARVKVRWTSRVARIWREECIRV